MKLHWSLAWAGMVAALAAACTARNPRYCGDGVCTDPAYPFCDTTGLFGDLRQQCIAVACTPGEFAACRGDDELRCNDTGTNYDVTRCELGCDLTGGCRLCEPNQTACTNGTVATCDAAGNVTTSEPCPLGCFESEPRCREIDPSNNLGRFLDMVAAPPDLDLANPVFETATGTVLAGASPVPVPSFHVPPTGNGAALRVFVVGSLTLESATVRVDDGDPRGPVGPGIAILARGDVAIAGEVLVDTRVGSAVAGCTGAGRGTGRDDGNGRALVAGGGGGGNATEGGAGGNVLNGAAGGAPGQTSGTPGLVPLRGGCSGGYVEAGTAAYSTGGGALQLSSRTRILVDGTIDVRGQPGYVNQLGVGDALSLGGGGAGGAILLEAPSVTLSLSAKLLATGGDGAQGCATMSLYCSDAGRGASKAEPATSGADVPYTNTPNTAMMAGAGGGGLGRVRVNTRDGSYTRSSAAVEEAAVTTAVVRTR